MLITVNSGYRWPVDPTSHVQVMASVFGLSWCCDPQRFILVQKEKKGSICGPPPSNPASPPYHAGVALALRPARGWKGPMYSWWDQGQVPLSLSPQPTTIIQIFIPAGLLIFTCAPTQHTDPMSLPRGFSQFILSQIYYSLPSSCSTFRAGRTVGFRANRCVHYPLPDIFT